MILIHYKLQLISFQKSFLMKMCNTTAENTIWATNLLNNFSACPFLQTKLRTNLKMMHHLIKQLLRTLRVKHGKMASSKVSDIVSRWINAEDSEFFLYLDCKSSFIAYPHVLLKRLKIYLNW